MARVTPQEYAEDWAKGLTMNTDKIRRGIDKVATSPTEKAAKAQDTMLAKLTQSVNDGTWAAQLRKVTKEDWQNSAKTKGLARIGQGVEQAKAGQVAMAERLLAAVDQATAITDQTPRGDLETNISRSATFQREMAKRKLRRPAGR